MAEPKERLFRDEAGAAIERIQQLEEENRALRMQADLVVGERKFGMGPLLFRYGLVALVVGTAGFLIGRQARPLPECEPASASSSTDLCNPPTWVDAQGATHLKPNCGTR